MPDVASEFLNESDLAKWLGCSVAKLQADRWKGRGIPYVKIGRMVRYRKCDVEAYLNSQYARAKG